MSDDGTICEHKTRDRSGEVVLHECDSLLDGEHLRLVGFDSCNGVRRYGVEVNGKVAFAGTKNEARKAYTARRGGRW